MEDLNRQDAAAHAYTVLHAILKSFLGELRLVSFVCFPVFTAVHVFLLCWSAIGSSVFRGGTGNRALSTFVEQKDQKHHLVQLIANETVRYRQSARKKVNDAAEKVAKHPEKMSPSEKRFVRSALFVCVAL